MTDPMAFLQDKRMQLDFVQQKLAGTAREHLQQQQQRFARLTASLDALSPLKVLGRGYAMAQGKDGTVLKSSDQVAIGEKIYVRLGQGSLHCRVDRKE